MTITRHLHMFLLSIETQIPAPSSERFLFSYVSLLARKERRRLTAYAIAIEVKAKERVSDRDLRGVRALMEALSLSRKIVVSNERWRSTTDDHIEIFPVDEFLQEVWNGNVI
jgi:hypothetical protein